VVCELAKSADDVKTARYRRLTDTDPAIPFSIVAPSPESAARVRDLIAESFCLLDAGHPMLAGEICEIFREIVLSGENGDPASGTYEGVSSFMLRGAVILNVEKQKDVLDMVQVLAHESGHNLLFALCADGPLQDNSDDELYDSPLREDPRPMDGIVHATYASARLHQSVERLADSGVLGPG
jgi:HEXXH motif-containing protein